MNMYPIVLAFLQRSSVNKDDICTFAQKHFLYEHSQWDDYFFFQFYKMAIGNDIGKKWRICLQTFSIIKVTTVAQIMESIIMSMISDIDMVEAR